jgi:hypothetical protein
MMMVMILMLTMILMRMIAQPVSGFTMAPSSTSYWPYLSSSSSSPRAAAVVRLLRSSPQKEDQQQEQVQQEQLRMQWDLFLKHHARGVWNGWWTTVDAMGDVLDEIPARVLLEPTTTTTTAREQEEEEVTTTTTTTVVRHAHEIPLSRRAAMDQDLMTEETKILEIASYNPLNLARSHIRLAGCGMVVGPRIVGSGSAVLLELGLRFESYRLRAVVQVAPAFLKNYNTNEEEESPPPPPAVAALKVARVTLCRETLFDYIPSPRHEEEGLQQGTVLCLHKGVPPFAWHGRNWTGTSWTWGPQMGDRGWQIDRLEADDRWHGSTPVEYWNWKTGSASLSFPKLIVADDTASAPATTLFRMAWLPDPDHLLRIEAGIVALQPVWGEEEDEEAVVGFDPPKLVSLRCDMLRGTDGDPIRLTNDL